jgi:type I restriction enzyme S subunit
MQSQNQGTSIRGITRDTLSGIEIILPPTTDEQSAIAKVLSDMDAEIESLEAKLAKARLIKQGMMQELLTGNRRLV